EEIPVLVSAAPLRAPDGAFMGVVGAFQDLSPLRQSERQREAFLNSAAHDLRNPLTTIVMRAEVLQEAATERGLSEQDEIHRGLKRSAATAERARRLLNEMVDVARLDLGQRLELRRRSVDLVALARRVVTEHRRTARRHHIALASDDPELVGEWDSSRLERV